MPKPSPAAPPPGGWRLPAGLAAFRHRDYRILWSVQAGSLTGNWMQSLAQSWLVLTMTDSPIQLALINVCQFGPALIFGLPAGVIADRYSKRGVLLVTQTLAGALTAVLAILVALNAVQLWHIYAVGLGIGIVSAVSNPARQAFVVDVVGRNDLVNAVALNSALFNASRVIGPAIAGFLLGQVGVAICFIVNAVAYVPVVIGLTLLRARGMPVPGQAADSPWGRLREGIAYVRRTPAISGPIMITGVLGTFGMNFSVWMPLLAVRLNAGAEGFGWLMTAFGLGSLAGALTVAFFARSLGRRALVFAPLAFAGLELGLGGLTAIHAPMLIILPLATAIGLAMSITLATANTTVQSLVPDALRGRVSSIYMTVFLGTVPIGALIAGMTTAWLGLFGSILAGATVVLVAAVTFAASGFRLPANEPRSAPGAGTAASHGGDD